MAKYDPAIIDRVTDALYKQADSTETLYTIVGFLAGVVGGSVFARIATDTGTVLGLMVFVLILGIAVMMGRAAALRLRFQAQQVLVLAEIERNTRTGRPLNLGSMVG